jgi:FtsP/CotA-like multicopper oxidase with cupredoxin domain
MKMFNCVAVILLGFFAALASGCGGGGGQTIPPSSQADTLAQAQFPEAPVLHSSNGLVVLDLTAAIDPLTNAPGFAYNGQFVAPTLEIKPGDTLDVTYHNALPGSATPPNHTNLHFHGMAIPPNPPADDVLTTLAMPGDTLHYVVHVPAYEQPGLYWYHTHPHGESNWQVTNGMAGAIIVEGIQQIVPALAGMREHVIILRQPQNHPDFATLGRMRRTESQELVPEVRAAYNPCRPNPNAHVTINGLREAVLGVNPGERQLFRVLNAASNRFFDLAVDGESIQLVSMDSYPLASLPGNAAIRTVDDILLPPGSRAEFIVTGKTGGTVLRTRCVDTGPFGDPVPPQILVHLRPSNDTPAAIVSDDAHVQNGPLQQALPAPSVFRTVLYTENNDTREFFINNRRFSIGDPPAFIAHAGTVEEWTVENATLELHTFHIHQVHFIAESINGVAQSNRQWLDNVTVPYATRNADGSLKPGIVKLLLDFRDPVIRGTFVFHCHLLEHEDNGMMAKIRVE